VAVRRFFPSCIDPLFSQKQPLDPSPPLMTMAALGSCFPAFLFFFLPDALGHYRRMNVPLTFSLAASSYSWKSPPPHRSSCRDQFLCRGCHGYESPTDVSIAPLFFSLSLMGGLNYSSGILDLRSCELFKNVDLPPIAIFLSYGGISFVALAVRFFPLIDVSTCLSQSFSADPSCRDFLNFRAV